MPDDDLTAGPADPSDRGPEPVEPTEPGDDPWSSVASEWAALWGPAASPAHGELLRAAGVRPGTRVLDVGCGTGDLLAALPGLGAHGAGADPAPGMVRLARRAAPAADVRVAPAEALPWPNEGFDVVTAVNVLPLTGDPDAAVAELVRVLAPGGRLVVCGWAGRGDLDVLEAALAAADGEPAPGHDPLHGEAGLRALLEDAGLVVEAVREVEVAWPVPDAATLVRAVLVGEDAAGLAERGPVVTTAAEPLRRRDGGYRLRLVLRYAVARVAPS